MTTESTRRDLVARLAVRDATVGELAAPYGVSVQAISKHLLVLERAGLLTKTKVAQRRRVHLEAEVPDLMTGWIERNRRRAEGRSGRLDHLLLEIRARWPKPASSRHRRCTMNTTSTAPAAAPAAADRLDRASIEADPNVPIIHIRRDFHATPAQLLSAHIDPALFVRWVGPDGMETRTTEWDARDGGSWRYVASAGGVDHEFRGCFHQITGSRIVQTFTWMGRPDDVALETLEFDDLGDGRTRLHAQSLCDGFGARDGWLASGMEVGVDQGYAKLDLLLAGRADS
ncbi:MAG: SRPBCC domain-containing protein [Microthrixaceae bacterium]